MNTITRQDALELIMQRLLNPGDATARNLAQSAQAAAAAAQATANSRPTAQQVADLIPEQRVLIGEQTPSAETLNKLNFFQGLPEFTESYVQHEATAQTATFRDFQDANYLGINEGTLNAESYNVGQWYFHPLEYRPYVVTDLDPITPGLQLSLIHI